TSFEPRGWSRGDAYSELRRALPPARHPETRESRTYLSHRDGRCAYPVRNSEYRFSLARVEVSFSWSQMLRTCRTCGMKVWPRAIPRPMRFHDLRHSAATLLLRAGVDIHRVQRILRHRDVKLTTGTYAHLQVEDLRAAVDALSASTEPPKSLPFTT